MKKPVSINLARISYRGQSIGRDIEIEIKIFEQHFKIEKIIQPGETKEINHHLGTFNFDKDIVDSEVVITVTEKDLLFSDSKTIKTSIHINTTSKEVQGFVFTVKVGERRSWWKRIFWGSREAIFEIHLDAKVQTDAIAIKKYSYTGVDGNEDYNRYDDLIVGIVEYWNNEFLRDTDPHGEQILLKYDAQVLIVKDSITWGVRWLYHKAQWISESGGRRNWYAWKQAVDRYGPSNESYDKDVWGIYKNGVKKERGTILQLWSFTLLIPFLFFSFFGHDNSDLRSLILNSVDADQQAYVDDIEIKYNNLEPSIFATVIEYEKDWSEELKLGVWNGEQVKWIDIEEEPTENYILSFRFIKLVGFTNPILEVYGKTHMGHGSLYIYEIEDKRANLLLTTIAVDSHPDSRYNDEIFEKYGHYYCGEIYRGGALTADYTDVNNDGITDVILSGTQDIYCEAQHEINGHFYTEEIKVAEIPIEKRFILK